jgi:hypothetical protein
VYLSGWVTDLSGVITNTMRAELFAPDGFSVSGAHNVTVDGFIWEMLYPSAFPLNGSYDLALFVEDLVGNVYTATNPIEIDGTLPAADLAYTGDEAGVIAGTGGSQPILRGTVHDIPLWPSPNLSLHFEESGGNEVFYDASANRNHATCSGATCPSVVGAGRYGQSLAFDGADDYLTVATTDAAGLAVEGPVAMAAWVKPASASGEQTILSHGPAGSPTRQVSLRIKDGQYQVGARYDVEYLAAAPMPAGDVGQWVHLVGVFDGEAWHLYRNGQVLTYTETLTGAPGVDADWTIGAASGPGSYFQGELDEIFIYDHALAADDVRQMADPVLSGFDTLEIGLQHAQDRDDPSAIIWNPVTVAQPGAAFSTWQYQMPEGIEGPHQIYLRVTDTYVRPGTPDTITLTRVLSNTWQGEIDTWAPRATLHTWGQQSGPGAGAYYACEAQDYNLTKEDLDCPVATTNFSYQDATWYTELFSSTKKLFRLEGDTGAWLPDAGGPYTLTVCDLYDNCSAVGPTLTTQTNDPAVWIDTPTPLAAYTNLNPIAISGGVYASAGLDQLQVAVNGTPIYNTSWGSEISATWSTSWTPSAQGVYTLSATLGDDGGGSAVNTDGGLAGIRIHDSVFYVDTAAPTVSISTDRVNDDNYERPGYVTLSGTADDAVGLKRLEARVHNGDWQEIPPPVGTTTWQARVYAGTPDVPDNDTYTLYIRATDVASQTTATSRDVPADADPPALFTVTVAYDAGASGWATLKANDTVQDVLNPTLRATWGDSSDPSGLDNYIVEWLDADTLSVLQTRAIAGNSDTFAASELQKLKLRVTAQDSVGNQTSRLLGPFYVDHHDTPAYVDMAETARGGAPYHNWLLDTCNLVGIDDRVADNSVALAALNDPQNLYATWNATGLRLTWTGADWDSDGDLFIYLDTVGGGSTKAYDPDGNDAVIWLPVENGASPDQMAADWLLWVQDNTTAQLMEWNGGGWTDSGAPFDYVFDADQETPTSDLFVPFSSLSIADPAATPLAMVALASEEDALRLWVTMPPANGVNSARVVERPDRAFEQFALTRRYIWTGLGAGVCPRQGQPTTADVRLGLNAEPAGIAYSLLNEGLYFEMPDLLPSLVTWETDPTAERALIGNAAPAGLDYFAQRELAGVLAVNPPPVGDGQTIDVVLSFANQGGVTATGLTADVRTWGPIRLISATVPITHASGYDHLVLPLADLAAGETATATFRAQIDLTFDPAHQVGWATLDALVYDGQTSSKDNPLDWLYLDLQVDDRGPTHVELDPTLFLVGAGEAAFNGAVVDASPVPSLTVKVNGTNIECANQTPDDLAWSCDLDLSALGLNDGDVVDVRVRATDAHGQASDWSKTQQLVVDATRPSVGISLQTRDNFSDTLIGPLETTLDGLFADERLPAAVEVCDTSDGEETCANAEVLVDAPQTTYIYEDVADPPLPLNISTICGGGEIQRTFTITQNFSIVDLDVGLNISHTFRNDLVVILTSPGGLTTTLLSGGTWADHYDVRLDDATATALSEDYVNHNVDAPYYENGRRPTGDLSVFSGEPVSGMWTLSLCDRNPGPEDTDDGLYRRSQLFFSAVPTLTQSITASWQYIMPVEADVELPDQSLAIYALDGAGNRSTPAVSLTYTLDTIQPIITYTTRLTETYLGTGKLEGLVSDNIGLQGMRIKFHDAWGDTLEAPLTPTVDGEWSFDASDVLDEIAGYAVYVEATDLAGNSTTEPVNEITVMEHLKVFLPVVTRNFVSAPDLVIDSIVATSNDVQIVIRNQGNASVSTEFWVQVYFDPNPIPTAVNQVWYNGYANYGLFWGVTPSTLPLRPGDSLALSVGDAFYTSVPPFTVFPPSLPAGTPVYVQVDAVDLETDYGAVRETHEIRGESYNNISSTLSLP